MISASVRNAPQSEIESGINKTYTLIDKHSVFRLSGTFLTALFLSAVVYVNYYLLSVSVLSYANDSFHYC